MASETTLRYIKTDFQSHKDALLQRVRARWPRAWNDFLANSFGIVLVDIVAWATSTMAFLVNRIGGENFIGTMTLRESAVRVGQLVGYRLHNPIPAVVSCEATLSSTLTTDVTISKGTQIRSSDSQNQTFEVVRDYVIEAGELTPKTSVATFSVTATGRQVVNSLLRFTASADYVDVLDTTVDLGSLVQIGQSLNREGSTTTYQIIAIETAPGSVGANTRLILDRAYESTTEDAAAEVFDRRILLVQGQTITEKFTVPSAESNVAGYIVQLSRTPVIDNSVDVTVNGERWQEAAYSVYKSPTDKVFVVQTFTNGRTTVRFGDDQFGAAVPADASIDISYRVGGGSAGNITLNQIATSIIGITADTSSPVSVAVTNSTATGSGGQDAETLEQARTLIPYYTRTGDRCVTEGDYQTFAQAFNSAQYGSVAYARASVRRDNALLEGNIVNVYAWTTGPGGGLVNLSATQKQALKDYMQERAMATDFVEVYDGTNRPIPLSLRFKAFSGFDVTDTASLVTDAVSSFVSALRPGDPVLYSNLVRTLDEVYGVDTVNMATPIADLTASNDTELFTLPDDSFVYEIDKLSAGTAASGTLGVYTAQLPVYPLSVWSLRLFLGATELTILPYYRSGLARVIGSNLSTDETDSDGDGLPDYHSVLNLLTGQLTLYVSGVAGDLTMKLNSVTGYSQDRAINVYVGYLGDNSLTKRREIRSYLRAWSEQLAVGQAIYARRVSGIVASSSSVEDVVQSVPGVDTITRVALDSPASTANRVTAGDYELLRFANIIINNQAD
jgi:hypothetical protein